MSYQLRITEIFYSLQGETSLTGLPTVFVRLTGCPLRCEYCDTTYAFKGGDWLQSDEIIKQVSDFDAQYVCVTGGEPLAQKDCRLLLKDLCDKGFTVSLETSGSIDIQSVDPRVIKIVDVKTPGSAEQEKNLIKNYQYLTPTDQIKFVICDRTDYEWAKDWLNKYSLEDKCPVLFSPSEGVLEARQLADWILEDHLRVRLQIQLHKLLWGGGEGR